MVHRGEARTALRREQGEHGTDITRRAHVLQSAFGAVKLRGVTTGRIRRRHEGLHEGGHVAMAIKVGTQMDPNEASVGRQWLHARRVPRAGFWTPCKTANLAVHPHPDLSRIEHRVLTAKDSLMGELVKILCLSFGIRAPMLVNRAPPAGDVTDQRAGGRSREEPSLHHAGFIG